MAQSSLIQSLTGAERDTGDGRQLWEDRVRRDEADELRAGKQPLGIVYFSRGDVVFAD